MPIVAYLPAILAGLPVALAARWWLERQRTARRFILR
jgi:hypothetical protein